MLTSDLPYCGRPICGTAVLTVLLLTCIIDIFVLDHWHCNHHYYQYYWLVWNFKCISSEYQKARKKGADRNYKLRVNIEPRVISVQRYGRQIINEQMQSKSFYGGERRGLTVPSPSSLVIIYDYYDLTHLLNADSCCVFVFMTWSVKTANQHTRILTVALHLLDIFLYVRNNRRFYHQFTSVCWCGFSSENNHGG